MRKLLSGSILTGTAILFLLSACGENNTDNKDSDSAAPEKVSSVKQNVADGENHGGSVMDQPVNFSTPEDVEKTLQKVRDQEGAKSFKLLSGAMNYLLTYDLALDHDKEKLHAKLNGKTPNEIIGMMRR